MTPPKNGSTVKSHGKSVAILNLIFKRRPRRNIRPFTARRMRNVALFMEKFVANPKEYGQFGTEKWMSALMKDMGEPARHGLITDDVKHWIRTEHYFLNWAKEHKDDGTRRIPYATGCNHVVENAQNAVVSEDKVMPAESLEQQQIVKKEVNQGAQKRSNMRVNTKAGEKMSS